MKNNSSDFQRLDKRSDMCYNKIKFFTFLKFFLKIGHKMDTKSDI